jgi:hypothetical protein
MSYIIIITLSVVALFPTRGSADCRHYDEDSQFWEDALASDFAALSEADVPTEMFTSARYLIEKVWRISEKVAPFKKRWIDAKIPKAKPGPMESEENWEDCGPPWEEEPIQGKKYFLLLKSGDYKQFPYSALRRLQLEQAAQRNFKPINIEDTLKKIRSLANSDAKAALRNLNTEISMLERLGWVELKSQTKDYYDLNIFERWHELKLPPSGLYDDEIDYIFNPAIFIFNVTLAHLNARLNNWVEAEKILKRYEDISPIAQFNLACYSARKKIFQNLWRRWMHCFQGFARYIPRLTPSFTKNTLNTCSPIKI